MPTSHPYGDYKDKNNHRFLHLRRSWFITRDKKRVDFIGVTAEALLTAKLPVESSVSDTGTPMCSFNFSIPNRKNADRIARFCGIHPRESIDENGNPVVWARATAFGNTATRLAKFVAKHPYSVIIICGRIQVEESSKTDKNGVRYVNTTIFIDDFYHVRDYTPKDAVAKPAAESFPTPSESPVAAPAITEIDPDDEDFDEDDELPF